MPRRRRRHTSKVKRLKYSNETQTGGYEFDFTTTDWIAGTNLYVTFIEPTPVQGMRKVKNFTLDFNICVNSTQSVKIYQIPFIWALVYYPAGMKPNPLQFPEGIIPDTDANVNHGSIWEPNQNVIMAGTCVANQIVHRKTRLARNLNSGDAIVFQVCPVHNISLANYPAIRSGTLCTSLNYAISY